MSDLACRDIRNLLGVYVLGAIDPADRSIAEEHLSQCRRCREELAGLAPLPALLRRVPLADAEQIAAAPPAQAGDPDAEAEPAAAGITSLLDHVAARRRTRRLRALVAAAAAVVISGGGAAAISQQLLATQPPASHHPDVSVGRNGVLTAWVSYQKKNWGTQLWVRVRGIKAGTTCRLWVIDKAGHRVADGGWTIQAGDASTWYPAATATPKAQVASFQITAGNKVLVTVPATS
jgi:hypothetical protein